VRDLVIRGLFVLGCVLGGLHLLACAAVLLCTVHSEPAAPAAAKASSQPGHP
jgi:hypothetical protein